MMKYDFLDRDRLFRTIYGEARGEEYLGMLAVGYVVCNRAKIAKAYMAKFNKNHPLFGSGTPASACTMPYQFSCWNLDDPNLPVIIGLKEDDPGIAVQLCVTAAVDALEEKQIDPSKGADHYHSIRVHPKWADGQIPTVVIGSHVFYAL